MLDTNNTHTIMFDPFNILLISFHDTTSHLTGHIIYIYILEEYLQSMNFDPGCLLQW